MIPPRTPQLWCLVRSFPLPNCPEQREESPASLTNLESQILALGFHLPPTPQIHVVVIPNWKRPHIHPAPVHLQTLESGQKWSNPSPVHSRTSCSEARVLVAKGLQEPCILKPPGTSRVTVGWGGAERGCCWPPGWRPVGAEAGGKGGWEVGACTGTWPAPPSQEQSPRYQPPLPGSLPSLLPAPFSQLGSPAPRFP